MLVGTPFQHLRLATASIVVALLSGVPAAGQSPAFVIGFERAVASASTSHSGGEILLTELSCTACHAARSPHLDAKGGPDLRNAGLRLQANWLREYLLGPHHTKPGTTMPDMLHRLDAPLKRDVVSALVAFLTQQRQPFPVLESTASRPVTFEFWRKGNPRRGRDTFHRVGCVACHEPDPKQSVETQPPSQLERLLAQLDPEEIEELGLASAPRSVPSVPLVSLSEKYTQEGLTHFLLAPLRDRPNGRMPDLKLTPEEAADVAAYLQREESPSLDAVKTVASEQAAFELGKKYFVELSCTQCHHLADVVASSAGPPLEKLDPAAEHSCLDRPQGKQAAYALSPEQVAALKTTLQARPLATPGEDQQLVLLMQQLNCYGCHEREGTGGVGPRRRPYFETAGHVDLGDEGRIPPSLDHVGWKLKAKWLTSVIEGQNGLRPYMHVRMPAFPKTSAEQLTKLLSHSDRVTSSAGLPDAVDTDVLQAGRQLFDNGCVQCHPLGSEHLPGVVGVDVANIAARLDGDWFVQFLVNPLQLKRGTRMPTFFPNGRSASPTILDGSVEQQVAALWTYLNNHDAIPLPPKLSAGRTHRFELVPQQRPEILRTFMELAGQRAIAVGFPAKVHFAFDAENCRLAEGWQGEFLDAHGTWFDRFAPEAKPLGEKRIEFASGMPFAVLESEGDPWPTTIGREAGFRFRGYRLDAARVPTFLYHFNQFEIHDRLEPIPPNGLQRTLSLKPLSEQPTLDQAIWFMIHQSDTLRAKEKRSVEDESGLRVTLLEPAEEPHLRSHGQQSSWRIVLRPHYSTIRLQYQW